MHSQCKTVLSYTSENGNSSLRKHKTNCDQQHPKILLDVDVNSAETIDVSSKIESKKSDVTVTKKMDITHFLKKFVPLSCKIELNNNIVRGLAKDVQC